MALTVLCIACGSAGTVGEARGHAAPIEPDTADAADLVGPSADVAVSLLRAVAAERGGNIAVSPILTMDGLSMVRVGSGGASRSEFDAVLGTLALDDAPLLASVAGAEAALSASEGNQRGERRQGTVTIDAASSIWLQRGTTLDDDWLDLLSRHLDRSARFVDFRSDPDAAREALDRWVSDETGGAIDQLAPRGMVTSTSRLVVATALWYEAPWAQPFDGSRTVDGPFTLTDGTTATVPFMRMDAERGLRHATGTTWEAVAIPYLGDDLDMVVVVPRNSKLTDLEAEMSGDRLTALLDDLAPGGVQLVLPRFSFTSELDLVGPLRSLGLITATDVEEADLESMAPAEPLALDDMLQQTYVSVDEEGTEQSAATVSETVSTPPPDLAAVVADQPFLFLVVHRPSKSILLIGHVIDPRG